jgi:transaldolase
MTAGQPAKKQKTEGTTNQLEQLKEFTSVVSDTGDINTIQKFTPQDATTNPSLLYKAAVMEEYAHLVDDAITYGKGSMEDIMDKLAVNFGVEITKIVPGYVSTEVDARLSFDTEATIAKAKKLIGLYKDAGVDKSRILIKVAATWEGIEAARILEKEEGITCNLTLMFGMSQAIACAEAKVTLISPFVGRIMDWYKAKEGVDGYEPKDDPGVMSVTAIYNYFKKFDYETVVMGASFRNAGEVAELAGCDKLTISPQFLKELEAGTDTITQKLSVEEAKKSPITLISMNEKTFRWMMNEDAMATEKLAEGIRGFTADIIKLEAVINKKLP